MLTKEEVIEWLKSHGKDREWLGQKLSVGKKTVDKWLSKEREIPQKAQIIISSLIKDDESIPQIKITQSLNLEFDEETYKNIEKRALESGVTVREWIKLVIKYVSDHPETKNILMGALQERGEKSTENNQLVAQNDPTIIRGLDRAEETPA